jgi:hypothetical protein
MLIKIGFACVYKNECTHVFVSMHVYYVWKKINAKVHGTSRSNAALQTLDKPFFQQTLIRKTFNMPSLHCTLFKTTLHYTLTKGKML